MTATYIPRNTDPATLETVHGAPIYGLRSRPNNDRKEIEVQLEKDGIWIPYKANGHPVFGDTDPLPTIRFKQTIDWTKPIRVKGSDPERRVIVLATDYRINGEGPPLVAVRLADHSRRGVTDPQDFFLRNQDGTDVEGQLRGKALHFENVPPEPVYTTVNSAAVVKGYYRVVPLTFTLADGVPIDVVLTEEMKEPLDGND